MIVAIPRATLHAQIHHEVGNVPVPDGSSARIVYERLVALEQSELLFKEDSVERRLRFLIDSFKDLAPETALAFEKQLAIVQNFRKEERPCLR